MDKNECSKKIKQDYSCLMKQIITMNKETSVVKKEHNTYCYYCACGHLVWSHFDCHYLSVDDVLYDNKVIDIHEAIRRAERYTYHHRNGESIPYSYILLKIKCRKCDNHISFYVPSILSFEDNNIIGFQQGEGVIYNNAS